MEQMARNVGPARIDIAYERLGDPNAPPVLLIMGLGAQLVAWPDGLCDQLLGHGLQLVRFDNRDAGESTHFQGAPNFMAAMAGDTSSALYNLSVIPLALTGHFPAWIGAAGMSVSSLIEVLNAMRVSTGGRR